MKSASTYFIQLIFSSMFMHTLTAQHNSTEIAGTYFLKGVMETASVFDLKADSSFEFFFSQGALDRGGKGKWTVKNSNVVLNSIGKGPARDYALVSSKTIPGNFTIIKMMDKNTMILSYSDVAIKTPGGNLQESTNSQGEIQFEKKNATEISLLFRLCPDRSSVFTVDSRHNYFEFKLEPWIADVFFENFELPVVNKGFSGKHPLLEGHAFRYEKEKK